MGAPKEWEAGKIGGNYATDISHLKTGLKGGNHEKRGGDAIREAGLDSPAPSSPYYAKIVT